MAVKNLTTSLVKKFIPVRKNASRKGDNGTVVVVGGSHIYHGAPILTSLASLRSGCDLVYTAIPKINIQATRSVSPNLIVIPLADQKLTRGTVTKLLGQIPKKCDVATIGMGLAVQDVNALKHLVSSLANQGIRLSLDASALVPQVLEVIADKNVVVTPHAGEFKRLFGEAPPEKKNDRIKIVERHAKNNGITVLLKGSTDVISDGKTTCLNQKRVPAMTVGGTGDVLSGLVAGILSRNKKALDSAAAAAHINGLAGMQVQKQVGLHMTSMDLIDAIPKVMKRFDRIV